MKITKRQLRRVIKEEIDPRLATMDYREWAEDYMGTLSGANSSSVLATYAVEQELSEEDWMPIALAMDFTPRDVGLEIVRQQKEYDAGGTLSDEESYERSFKESRMKITKRQLRRIIKEEKQKLLREGQSQEEALFSALDQYVMVLDEEMGYDVPQEELKAEVLNFVDGYFEQTENVAAWDEADQDHADQQYAAKHGNPYDENY